MKHRPAILLFAFAALLRCSDAEGPSKPKAPPPQNPELLHRRGPDDSADRANLLNFAHGAVVVSRTGEASLENSAACAIDGDPATAWLSPVDDPDQTLVFALPARARIRSVGVQLGGEVFVHPKSVEFAVSADGNTFTSVASFSPPPNGMQLNDTPPTEARYVRFQTKGGNSQFVRAMSVFARGELLEPVNPGPLDGCWSVNDLQASFAQRGASVTGAMEGKTPIAFEGGSDGRFYRLLWIRGPEYGVAAISVTPDGRHLSGMFWHEEAYNRFLGTTWFGEKRPCASGSDSSVDVMATYMQRYGRFPLYGLQFDGEGRLIEPASEAMLARLAAYLRRAGRMKLVAHELGLPDKAHNQAASQAKIDSVRAVLARKGIDMSHLQLIAVGSDSPHRPASTDAARSVYGAVELMKP